MTDSAGLSPPEIELIRGVLRLHVAVEGALLFGSRAKGQARRGADVDLALQGPVEPLEAAAIARELDELPLPYRFDVQALASITHPPVREHIDRVGVPIYWRDE